MEAMRLIWTIAAMLGLAGITAHAAPGPWDQPVAALADQIAAVLGPAQAHLTIRNISTIPTDAIPTIRRLLVQDLKSRGVTAAGAESANTVRLTLSESAHKRLMVAEIIEDNLTQVAIVDLGSIEAQPAPLSGGLTLLSQPILSSQDPVLAVAESPVGLVALEPAQLVLYTRSSSGWQEAKRIKVDGRRQLARDPRGVLTVAANHQEMIAWLPGTRCDIGSATTDSEGWSAQCRDSDDPWPLAQAPLAQPLNDSTTPDGTTPLLLSAFYNASRDYFTGVVTPGIGVDLPPFYTAALIPRTGGSGALLIGGLDGKMQLAENGALKPVAGTRDWGSDFATLHTGCGTGTQILVSGSGEAITDSLRAYELPALDAIAASAPLAESGTVMALATAEDGKSVLAVVRKAPNQYEVDRVTALCN